MCACSWCACTGGRFYSYLCRKCTVCIKYMSLVCMCILLEAMLSCRWICLISYKTNQSLFRCCPPSLFLLLLLIFLSLSSATESAPTSFLIFFFYLTHHSLQILPLMPFPSCYLLALTFPSVRPFYLSVYPLPLSIPPPLYLMGSRCCFLSSSLHFLPVVLLPWCWNGKSVEGYGCQWGGGWEMGKMPWDALCINGLT